MKKTLATFISGIKCFIGNSNRSISHPAETTSQAPAKGCKPAARKGEQTTNKQTSQQPAAGLPARTAQAPQIAETAAAADLTS